MNEKEFKLESVVIANFFFGHFLNQHFLVSLAQILHGMSERVVESSIEEASHACVEVAVERRARIVESQVVEEEVNLFFSIHFWVFGRRLTYPILVVDLCCFTIYIQ